MKGRASWPVLRGYVLDETLLSHPAPYPTFSTPPVVILLIKLYFH